MAHVGVDLGTSNSCCYAARAGEAPEAVLSLVGHRLTPSVVAYTDREVLVGDPAVQQQRGNPHRTFVEFKRLLSVPYTPKLAKESTKHWPFGLLPPTPREGPEPRLAAFHRNELLRLAPADLGAVVLAEIRRAVREHLGPKTAILSTTITVPAHYGDPQRRKTIAAARRAGFRRVKILNEPTAAMLAYFARRPERFAPGDIAVVVDLGAGTLDVSCVRVDADRRGVRIVSSEGCSTLGGADFDRRLLAMASKHHKLLAGTRLEASKPRLAAAREACERAKRTLSTQKEASIVVADDVAPLVVSREAFAAAIAPDVARVADTVLQTLRKAGLEAGDVKHVVMCGGSTRVPSVRATVRRLFPAAELLTDINPDECVALGACLSGTGSTTPADVVPATVGIHTGFNVMAPMIRKNARLPATATRVVYPGLPDQTFAEVHVYQGEHADIEANVRLGGVRIEGLRPGHPPVRLKLRVDEEGCVSIEARDDRGNAAAGDFHMSALE